MRVTPPLLGAVLLLLVSAGMPAPAQACSCIAPPPPEEALVDADAVFHGKVVQIASARDGASGFARVRVTFVVQESWKGVRSVYMDVYTARDGATCGFGFRKEERYLVYAYADGRTLHTGLCTRTRSIDQAAEDLLALGDGEIWDADDGGGCGGPTNAAALQVVVFTLLGLMVMRRRFG